jgi:hypothetical protein
MSNILERISLLAEYQGIKITSLEKKIGASKGVLSRALKNNTDIQSVWIIKIVENYPQINTNWLLTGEGPMLKDQSIDKDVKIVAEPLATYGEKQDSYIMDLQKEHIEMLKQQIKLLSSKYEACSKELQLCQSQKKANYTNG